MMDDTGPFPQSALDTNRIGSLTDAQRQQLGSLARGVRKRERNAAFLAAVFGIVVFIAVNPSAPVLVRVWLPVGCLALAAILLYIAFTGRDRLSRDLQDPHVESLEGPISRQVVTTTSHGMSSHGDSITSYYLTVAGRRFSVGSQAYRAAPDAGFVRLYFLHGSRHVVNLEHLPDRPLPEGSTAQTLLHEFRQAIFSRDRTRLDEMRAEMAGTAGAFQAGISHDVAPPPAASRDRRPLGQAITGTWNDGPLTITFGADGSFRVTMLGAHEYSGEWSTDGDGRLVVNFRGHEQATDAWIVGDQLTLTLDGSAITLQRSTL